MKSPIVPMGKTLPSCFFFVWAPPTNALPLGQKSYIEDVPSRDSFPIVQGKTAATIYVDSSDLAGVVRAASDLKADVARVTSLSPAISHEGKNLGKNIIIIGTIGKSLLIDRLIRERKIDDAQIF